MAKLDKVPAVTVVAAAMLATANIRLYKLEKALAKLGCSCTLKTREIEPEAHQQFCNFRVALEDLS